MNSVALLTFLVLNLNGTQTLMFHMTTCGFLPHPKAKITKFGDKQASRIGVCTKYVFVRCTWMTNLEAPQLECLGAQRSSQNFYLGDQL